MSAQALQVAIATGDAEVIIAAMSVEQADALLWPLAPGGPVPAQIDELVGLVVYEHGKGWQPTMLGAEVAHRIVDLTVVGALPWGPRS